MTIIGIDPGLSGAIAVVRADGQYVEHVAMPVVEHARKGHAKRLDRQVDAKGVCDLLTRLRASHGDLRAVLERQHVISGQGLSSSGKTMFGFGVLVGLLAGFDIPTQVVGAREWQKAMLDPSIEDTKAASIAAVKAWDDSIDLRPTRRAKKDHDGFADAINLARHGYATNEKVSEA